MQKHNVMRIAAVELIDAMVLQIKFTLNWTMEDSAELTEKLLLLTSTKVIERVQGADLHSIRLRYDNYELLLNFEEYSHSCWLECITEQDSKGLYAIQQLLSQSINVLD
jgi:hypothetical protein